MTQDTISTPALPCATVASLLAMPWAILPESLAQVQAIAALQASGGVVDLGKVGPSLHRQLAGEQPAATINDQGVAVMSIDGILTPKANTLTQLFGGVSTQALADRFNALRTDAQAKAALLIWDSPGGQVHAVPAAAAALQRLAAAKPTVSLVRGVMASAGYWIGSAANAVYLEGSTDIVGSLGVFQRLTWQGPEPNTLDLVRGKYKRLSTNGQPPSAEVVADAVQQLDYLYTVLVDAVAQHRGVSAGQVLRDMAEGRLFTGTQAVRAGLADGLATAGDLVKQLATEPKKFKPRRRAAPPSRGAVGVLPVRAAVCRGAGDLAPSAYVRTQPAKPKSWASLRADSLAQAATMAVQIRALQAEHAARGSHLNVLQAIRLLTQAPRST